MIGSIVAEVAAGIITALVVAIATLVAKIYRGQLEARAENREFRLLLSHTAAETATLQASLAECQRNCRNRSELYVRTDAKFDGIDRRVSHLEEIADSGGL